MGKDEWLSGGRIEVMREDLLAYCKKRYETDPDYPWREEPDYTVLRHADDKKWYGLVMYLPKEKLGLAGHTAPGESMEETDEYIDVINLKCDPELMELLRMTKGILPAYHMSHKHWITVLLDGTVSWEQVKELLDLSFELTASKKELAKFGLLQPKDWIIPANPAYYDVIAAFEASRIIRWKEIKGVREGDTIFIYVAAPYSAILFQCKVLELELAVSHEKDPKRRKGIYLELERTFDPKLFTFEKLKQFDVRAVRGPRTMPKALREEIDRN